MQSKVNLINFVVCAVLLGAFVDAVDTTNATKPDYEKVFNQKEKELNAQWNLLDPSKRTPEIEWAFPAGVGVIVSKCNDTITKDECLIKADEIIARISKMVKELNTNAGDNQINAAAVIIPVVIVFVIILVGCVFLVRRVMTPKESYVANE